MHVPVLYQEVINGLQPEPGGQFIDGTLGVGGHAAAILAASAPDGRVLAFDRDESAIIYARERLGDLAARVTFIADSYTAMAVTAPTHGFSAVDGVLLDLGLSSRQLDAPERGFSFRNDGPLDMRFDRTRGETAADLINGLSAAELADIFWQYGEERRSRQLAQIIVRNRPFSRTGRLAELIAAHSRRGQRRHPATQIFQALRIAVNDELGAVAAVLPMAVALLRPGGRLAVISFHSLEDRLVKQFMRQASLDFIRNPARPELGHTVQPQLRLTPRKAIKPTVAEINQNPRSRSARLRVAEKL